MLLEKINVWARFYRWISKLILTSICLVACSCSGRQRFIKIFFNCLSKRRNVIPLKSFQNFFRAHKSNPQNFRHRFYEKSVLLRSFRYTLRCTASNLPHSGHYSSATIVYTSTCYRIVWWVSTKGKWLKPIIFDTQCEKEKHFTVLSNTVLN